MIEALKETDLFCEEYFSTRADLAYLGAYSPRVYQTNYEEKGKLLDGTR